MTKERYTLTFHFLDIDQIERRSFASKVLALDWFDDFCKTNSSPVIVTLYNGISPCWVYHGDKDLF